MREASQEKAPLTLEIALQDKLRGLFRKYGVSLRIEDRERLNDNARSVLTAMASDFIKLLDSQGLESDLLRDFMVNFRTSVIPVFTEMLCKEWGVTGVQTKYEFALEFSGACIEAIGRGYEDERTAQSASKDGVVALTSDAVANARALTEMWFRGGSSGAGDASNNADAIGSGQEDKEGGGAGENSLG